MEMITLKILIGLIVGTLIGLTGLGGGVLLLPLLIFGLSVPPIIAVGSDIIILMRLVFFYSYPPKVMVGTDIVHAVALTGVTSFLHFRLGNIDLSLVGYLLIGSIPGGLVGSYLSTRVPVLWLRRILCAILLATGARMLWAPVH